MTQPDRRPARQETGRAVLILVHPGSACGSADFNLGRSEAEAARERLCEDLDEWHGSLIVIDSSLSDEIAWRPHLCNAIRRALSRADPEDRNRTHLPAPPDLPSEEQLRDSCPEAGFALRIWGCDDVGPHHAETVALLLKSGIFDPGRASLSITGAWYDPDGDEGCVNAVAAGLRQAGLDPVLLPGAVRISPTPDDEADCAGFGLDPA